MKKEKLERVVEKIKELISKMGRRSIAAVCAVFLIGCAVALNFVLFKNDGQQLEDENKPAINLEGLTDGDSFEIPANADGENENDENIDDYFSKASLERKQTRDQAMEVLLEVTESNEALDEAKQAAMADINKLALDIEREGNIETMITAKGFEKCVAVVNGDSASVIVAKDTLTPGETAQISEIVYEAAGIVPANLTIIEKSAG